ncbi:MAG: hypothetical protein AAFY98_10795 [Verrucomicrobiota bacterium]
MITTAPDSFGDDSDDKLRAMAMDCGFDYSRNIPKPDPKLLSLFPETLARRYHSIPVSRTKFGMRVHIPDPFDYESLDAIGHMLGEDLSPVVTPKEIIDKAIDTAYK